MNPQERAQVETPLVFVYAGILATTRFRKDFDMRARTWPAWYYLKGTRATDKCDMPARAARVASWNRNVENALVSQ